MVGAYHVKMMKMQRKGKSYHIFPIAAREIG